MKKIANFRPIVMFVLSLILGIIFAVFVFQSKTLKLIFFALAVVFALCFLIMNFKFKSKLLAIIAISAILFSIPIISIYFKQTSLNKISKYNAEEIVVSGRVCENYTFSNKGYLCLTLDDVNFIGADYKDNIKGKVRIYVSRQGCDLSLLEIGRYVSCFGEVITNNFNDGSEYSLSNLSKNIIAVIFAKSYSLNVSDKVSVMPDEMVRSYVYGKFKEYNVDYAEIGYGIMFGESAFIDEDIVQAFRTTGIAHILAVSGLHISIIVAVFMFVLKRLKTSDYTNLIIMTIILFIYAYLCRFSVSVVRAGIMSLMFLYFKARHKCYDRLSSISFSAICILLFSPLKLFNISFILSYTAVLSIVLLTNLFERLLSKIFYRKLASSLATILAVQFGLIFVQLYFFKSYSPVSIICNFITIPISTFAFIALIVGTIVTLCLPFMSFLLKVFDYLMSLIVKFNYTISKSAVILAVNNLNIFVVLLGLFLIILISDYLFIKKRYKAIGAISIIALNLILLFA